MGRVLITFKLLYSETYTYIQGAPKKCLLVFWSFHLAPLKQPIRIRSSPKTQKTVCKDTQFSHKLVIFHICVFSSMPGQDLWRYSVLNIAQWSLDSSVGQHRFGLANWAAVVGTCKDDKGALQMEREKIMQPYMRFWGTSNTEWVLLKWLVETGLRFWFQNTRRKVKTDFLNRFKLKNANRHFWGTLYILYNTGDLRRTKIQANIFCGLTLIPPLVRGPCPRT